MQLESLKMFCDVVETGSFSRAAQLNHVTQSAVSQQIRALENRYEQKLLSRSARQVTPTPAGERLFRGCKEILARFAEVEQEIREQATEVAGTSTVSTIYSVGLHELNAVQKQLLKAHPKVNMRLNYRRNDQVYDDVILGAAEIGIVAYPQPRAGVDILPFRDDKLAVVCAPNHSFATKQKVSLTALSGVPFIAFDREAPTRKALDRLFREKNIDINPVMEMDNVETIKRAVEMGLGVAILPMATAQGEVKGGSLVAKPFAEGPVSRPIGLLIRKGKYLDRASAAVLEAFKAAANLPSTDEA
ncbi:LysR family transcriptional regulator [Pyxidicoccus sp. 3LG]